MRNFAALTKQPCMRQSTAGVWVHRGHCAGGHLTGQHTCESSLEACGKHCKKNDQCGYFAYSTNKCHVDWGNCALYGVAAGCPDDNQFQEFDAYRVQRGLQLWRCVCPCVRALAGDLARDSHAQAVAILVVPFCIDIFSVHTHTHIHTHTHTNAHIFTREIT